MSVTFFCPLTHEGVLEVQGADNKKFLQGQLTCNLNYLSTTLSSLGARCNAKGRMISSFRILESLDSTYLLSMDKQLLEKQLIDLKKFAVFSKVTLVNVSEQWRRFGIQATEDALSFLNLTIPTTVNEVSHKDQLLIIKTTPKCFELWCSHSLYDHIKQLLANHLVEQPLNSWLLAQIQAGVGQVFAITSELFIPQMINIQALGGVSFKKGCYTGQEIVARMQYLGRLKRHLYRFRLAAQTIPSIGAAITTQENDNPIGEVVLSALTADKDIELLAVCQDDALQKELYLKPEKAKLVNLPLPYTVNTDEEIKR